MDVTLTPEQSQWRDAMARLAAEHAVTNPSLVATDDEQAWARVVELGVPGLRSPALSGVEAAGVESALAVESLGRNLCAVPVLGQGVVAPELLAAAGAADLLEEVASGHRRIAPTLTTDLRSLGRLGEPGLAIDAAGATHALLLDGNRLVEVELTAPAHVGLDLTRSVVSVADAPGARPIGDPIATDRLERAAAVALTMLAADLLGIMDGAVADAVSFAKDRHQFGKAIGSFQAVQHLLADAAAAVEGARSCVWHAAWAGDHLEGTQALLAARTAKAYCSEAGRRVVEATVQVFGGIAITWEHLSHVRLRRVHLDRECLGDEDIQYLEIAAARLDAQVTA